MQMESNRFIVFLAVLAITAGVPAVASAQTDWISVASEHFALYTDTNLEKGVSLLEDFESRYRAFSNVFLPLEARADPIRVVLIDDRSEFLDWVPEALRDHRKAAYLIQGSGGVFVLARDSATESIAEDVSHSMGHLFLSRTALWQPFWLQEGVGEFVRKLGRQEGGDGVSPDEAFSLPDILTIVPSESYDDLDEGGVFRRQAYQLLRSLIEVWPNEFERYLTSLREEEGFDAKPEVAVGLLEDRLFAYEDRALPLLPVPLTLEGQPVAPSELNALLGDLAATAAFEMRARDYYGRSSLEAARLGLAVLGKTQPAARRVFLQLIEDFPQSGPAHYQLGTLPTDSESDRETQIIALERAVRLMPRSGRARAELGLLYALGGEPEQAISLAHEALRLEPEFGDRFYEILAEAHMRRGQYERAAECIQIAASLPHSDSDPLSLERYDRLVSDFFRKMEAYRRDREASRLEELRREVDSLVEDVDPRPTPVVEEPAPVGRVAYSISSGRTSGVTPPELTEAPMPEYEAGLRRRGVEGRIVVEVELDRRGRISDLRIVSSESPELSEAVLEAVSQWRFEPARRGFESTAYAFQLVVNFYLE